VTATKQRALIAGAVAACAALLALVLWPRDKPPRTTDERAAAESPEAGASRRHRRAPRTRPRRALLGPRDAAPTAAPTAPTAPLSAAPSARATTRVEQLQTTVLQAAVKHDWVAIDEHDNPCPPERIRIIYDVPPDLAKYTKGAYFEPLGPAPATSTDEVNGLLLCEGSTFLYRGFEAYYRPESGQWDVYPFPVIE
jgi:hypothetical protein